MFLQILSKQNIKTVFSQNIYIEIFIETLGGFVFDKGPVTYMALFSMNRNELDTWARFE